jgi:hypothetical protein
MMPDWQKLVRKRLRGLSLHSTERDDVHTELAAHLEDAYDSLLRNGMSESEAAKRTLCLANDWQDLRREINASRRGEDAMTNRVTQLWLPGLLTFALSMGLLEIAEKFGPRPIVLELLKGTPPFMLYPSWLMILPLVGALGAYLSKRAGGSARMVLVSSVFPALPYAVVFMIAIPGGLVLSHALAHHIVTAAFFSLSLGWVLAPGIALLAGGLLAPFLLSRRSSSHGVSII